ncbi:MAG: alpha/beta hydrolase [Rhodospirillaceae bacterium]|jgi:pimeloyl-ACP methyl ester carboxylesterase|nr:alpha/beta hydrolase [Rhodospirillaceae bacterium]MBT4218507.1 alpha/beta hydrolase [Rhodospirillaceae bacterium]MBT4464885.1 alpha/beta hydrolase [Rhodospirillaceae bacterium]MBT5014092.1 alpha/beta hydrolase [Rhodospirillaceae bacterium]MBT5308373.1 alpha/beta hydrolase [Rhodospirillaceae bacterium]
MNTQDDAPTPAQILTRPDGATIAYRQLDGDGPGVVFLGGFMSDMEGSKAVALEDHCRATNRAFLRFDYTGHGQSSGDFADGTIGAWADDATFAIEELTRGPQVLVGSSMGGWIMLLVALRLKQRIAGLIGIAAAPDFTEDLIDRELTTEQRAVMQRDGKVEVACDYGDEPYTITQALIDDGREHLLLGKPIRLDLPVRLIQGIKDADVPWQTALRIQEMLESTDVEVTLVKDGGHRLSEAHDLDRLMGTLEALLKVLNQGP